jgi:hypothetical protein
MTALFKFTDTTGAVQTVAVGGRPEWALRILMATGCKGCTPIECPGGLRWAAYVHDLRAMGLNIQTIHERHGPPFPGRHARYVLTTAVEAVPAVAGCNA